jgi:RNA polymerase sigma factor (sigma-70 family)
MATSQMSGVIELLRRGLLLRDGAGLTDGQLLEGFISRGDEAALAALVQRRAPMVWGVCRRVLRNYHDAEDAFQATFLVLVRKGASIMPREMVANWLYGVAHQTALKARATAARRKERERQVTEMPEPAVAVQDLWLDLQPLLDEELSRLPDKYRSVIVLCDLDGKTRKEVARQLGCPEGTVAGRLARARVMLAKRLAQRGVALSGGALAAVLSQNAATAGVPLSVVSSAINAATLFAAGQAAATGAIPVKVAALTEGVVKAMLLTKRNNAMVALLVVAVVGFGASLCGTIAAGPGEQETQPAHKGNEQLKKAVEQAERDVEDADARLKNAKEQLKRLKQAYEAARKGNQTKEKEPEGFTAWGKEVSGLQAGLGFHPGEHRVYHEGEEVRLVVRVRNVGQKEVKLHYHPEFRYQESPVVTDAKGKPINLGRLGLGDDRPREANLAPGKSMDLYQLELDLRPANWQFDPTGPTGGMLFGTGKFSIQYERVAGDWSKLDPDLSKLGTGKLELEVTPLSEDGKWELRRDFKLDGKVEEAPEKTWLQLKRKGHQFSGHFVDKKANGKHNDSTFSGEVITHGKSLLILQQEHKERDGYVVIHTGQLVGENHYRGVWYDNAGQSGDFELKHSK